jgi:hypothetical protein
VHARQFRAKLLSPDLFAISPSSPPRASPPRGPKPWELEVASYGDKVMGWKGPQGAIRTRQILTAATI